MSPTGFGLSLALAAIALGLGVGYGVSGRQDKVGSAALSESSPWDVVSEDLPVAVDANVANETGPPVVEVVPTLRPTVLAEPQVVEEGKAHGVLAIIRYLDVFAACKIAHSLFVLFVNHRIDRSRRGTCWRRSHLGALLQVRKNSQGSSKWHMGTSQGAQ